MAVSIGVPARAKDLLTLLTSIGVMRFLSALSAAIFLIACNTASPAFRGAAPTRVTVQGSTFDVRVKADRAEAIRVNVEYAPRFGPIQARAGAAMAMVSGCQVVEVTGDQAQAFARLDCGNGPPPKRKRSAPLEIECTPVPGSEIAIAGEVSLDLDCAAF
ncbi:hypothetical protein [Sulfitobacter sp. EhC04]|uniref:hypothetical protein n=1 Tax=Sulfitobacter sp. EhC04 TaxID=1849168 RepID=UPI001912FFAF|nr:hypothetical protein [Sulfitobacter sp. EhC04]